MKVKRSALLLATAASLFLAACSGQESAGNKSGKNSTINYAVNTELSTLDSGTVMDINAANYIGLVQEGLYWENEKNEVQPALAKEMPEKSEDGLTYTVKMRDDAKWSNGDPVTAHDFVFAIRRLADPKTGAAYSYLLENFVNGPEIAEGKKAPEEIGVKALDDHTIEINLSKPTPYLDHLLSFVPFFPTNQKFVEEKGDRYGSSAENSIASGPYKMVEWDGSGLEWKLEKNPNYYNKDQVKVDNIDVQVMKEVSTNVNLFDSKKVDNSLLTGETVKQFADHPNAVQQEKARTRYLQLNYENKVLANRNFRQAVDYAIDNDELTQKIIGDGSKGLSTFVPENFVANPETGEDFVSEYGNEKFADKSKAKEHWEKAKSELGQDQVTVRLLADDDEKSKKESQYIQGQIEENMPGVKVEITNVPKKNRMSQVAEGNFDIVITGWGADYADASNFYDLFKSDNFYNQGHYKNPEYDKVVERAGNQDANDPKTRWEDFKEAQKILSDDKAVLVLYQEVETQLRNPNLKGITFRPVNLEYDFRTAYFE
ncbi:MULTISPECIES: peptide ABC transporter substrate-binding protein [Aerococcus]|uniref:peptide ABC transporter substrate-binding protein n=1 Tax=Aerococcus urinae (strain CCUG 59500 / ACS-120-V-Col10a) TaxID=2976812 RepID=UPI00227A0C44|nr:peptide ABC transporter substrate-binding protein [Aerococcus sp. Group 1]MCY3030128.1 peptide ABC transporter substrate-binding protein [Aerococcus sp. Group 1]MCY3054440.1 peptide ABC transporter substrate-binding protein [Aerococcus sp. Group 1]MCY3056170.1 peptide ABC transporter substrate-binding protein [Aerococcus sp. Group 1]MCY3061075.1 peptide ABC transporter substrate-binding protein [Aerococcus sp. Group 1]